MAKKKKRPAGRPAGSPRRGLVEQPPARTSVPEPGPADAAVTAETPLDLVRGLGRARRTVDEQLVVAVARARRDGATWRALGDALDVTPQAVQKRYGSRAT